MVAAAAALFVLSACDDPVIPGPPGAQPLDSATVRLLVQPGGAILEGIGATAPFTIEAVDTAGEPVDLGSSAVEWSVSNPEVARISPDGRVTALRDGQVAVTARVDALVGSGLVTVAAPSPATRSNVDAPRGSILQGRPD